MVKQLNLFESWKDEPKRKVYLVNRNDFLEYRCSICSCRSWCGDSKEEIRNQCIERCKSMMDNRHGEYFDRDAYMQAWCDWYTKTSSGCRRKRDGRCQGVMKCTPINEVLNIEARDVYE